MNPASVKKANSYSPSQIIGAGLAHLCRSERQGVQAGTGDGLKPGGDGSGEPKARLAKKTEIHWGF
jgi:hypothetical protein